MRLLSEIMNKEEKTKNDVEWEKIFERYDILSHIYNEGAFLISADQIKEYREPRLMVKFDHKINLPEPFRKNNLAILPVSRKKYIISGFEAYHKFEKVDKTVVQAKIPAEIQSLNINSISSETIALNCAFDSGILSDFLEEEILYPTVSGRMGTGEFGFTIQDKRISEAVEINVKNSQMEIDAAYEGIGSLTLIEAKRDVSEDFLVRQLYYPYRVWSAKVTKKVRPVFFVYSNGIFSLYEYEFKKAGNYNSLCLVRHKNYSIEDTEIELSDIENVARNTSLVNEPMVSFPQANRFERVINICELLNSHGLDREQITEEYAFDVRQTNYYTDAAIYLGLVEKAYKNGKPQYRLSKQGQQIINSGYRQRQLGFCQVILEHKAFRETFNCYISSGVMPSVREIVSIMEKANIYRVDSEKTYKRRASTIIGWINWILGLL